MYDDDGWDDPPLITDADIEQREMELAGAAIVAAHRAGRCTHGHTVAYRNPPVYPEQRGLEPGQMRCTETVKGQPCGRVFSSDDEWMAAIDEAVYG